MHLGRPRSRERFFQQALHSQTHGHRRSSPSRVSAHVPSWARDGGGVTGSGNTSSRTPEHSHLFEKSSSDGNEKPPNLTPFTARWSLFVVFSLLIRCGVSVPQKPHRLRCQEQLAQLTALPGSLAVFQFIVPQRYHLVTEKCTKTLERRHHFLAVPFPSWGVVKGHSASSHLFVRRC